MMPGAVLAGRKRVQRIASQAALAESRWQMRQDAMDSL